MILRTVAAASLAVLMGAACGPSEAGNLPAPSTVESGQNPGASAPRAGEQAFHQVSQQAPEFAGLYYEGSTLFVAVTDLAARERVGAAVQAVMFGGAEVELEFRQVRFSWAQLSAWRDVMLGAPTVAPSFSQLDADEYRNRVVVGVTRAADQEAVRQFGLAQGVPAEALVVDVVAPVYTLPLR